MFLFILNNLFSRAVNKSWFLIGDQVVSVFYDIQMVVRVLVVNAKHLFNTHFLGGWVGCHLTDLKARDLEKDNKINRLLVSSSFLFLFAVRVANAYRLEYSAHPQSIVLSSRLAVAIALIYLTALYKRLLC